MRTALGVWLTCLTFTAFGQSSSDPLAQDGYILPPKPIADAVLAPWWKNYLPASLSPDGKYYLVQERDGLPKLDALAKPHVNLAGLDVDMEARRSRGMTTRNAKSIRVVAIETGTSLTVPTPADARVSDPTWSPDGRSLAFLAHFADRSEAWVYNLDSKKAKRATAIPMLATAVNDLVWIDGNRLAAVLVPAEKNAPPEVPAVATSPKVAVSDAKKAKLLVYASLLGSPTEAAQLEYYTTGQLSLIDVASGKTQPVGKPGMIVGFDPSPDGKYFRVTLMERPFTYLFPYGSFPQREVIWDETGAMKVELSKRGPRGSDDRSKAPDRRSLTWRPDGQGLSYITNVPANKDIPGSKARDTVMLWRAPFGEKDTAPVWSSETRINSVQYSPDAKLLFVNQTVDNKTRISMVKQMSLADPVVVSEAGQDDDSVSLLTRRGLRTGSAVRVSPDGGSVYLSGTSYAKDPMKDAPRPFIDRVSLTDGKKTRVFESKADVYETASALDDSLTQLIVTRQSPSLVPNAYLLNSESKAEKKLTDNQDYSPDLTQARREWVPITRADGFKFWAKVTLPASYTPGAKFPAFFWFYPSETTGQDAYDKGRRTFNKNQFNGMSPSNKAALIRLGYVLVEPDAPIVGVTDRKNDTYVSNLRNNLAATIDELDRRGFIDRTRLGIGGHSYGAFSTANAMVHTPFFKCGIAGDGNFNRSLTPFGFQAESRQLWEGREVYLNMSPILYVEQITGALLMYHGMEDQNVGTSPINSERMFTALQANGKPAALYMYPYEDHGQIAQETILDQWARWSAWLDKYLKN